MEINFYQLEGFDYKAIAALLLKIREEKKRTLIYANNPEILKQLDDGLWSFSKTKFLPHSTKYDKLEPQDQPTFLTDEENNQNNAKLLIMLDPASDEFIKNFEKTFYFFGPSGLEKAREKYKQYKSQKLNLNFYKKDGDKWVKAS